MVPTTHDDSTTALTTHNDEPDNRRSPQNLRGVGAGKDATAIIAVPMSDVFVADHVDDDDNDDGIATTKH